MTRELDIVRLGTQGDGIAETAIGPVYVPFALPGERVSVEMADGKPRIASIERASPGRIAPICPHFGTCGACALQHLQSDAYLDWKRQLVVSALGQQGLTTPVDPVIVVGAASRRRVVLTAVGSRGTVRLGYHKAGSDEVIGIRDCPIAVPQIVRALSLLPAVIEPWLSRRGALTVTVTAADNGLDVDVRGARVEAGARSRRAAADAAKAAGLLRLTVDDELAYLAAEPEIAIGQARVVPPPGAFLQATAASQAAMTELVLSGVDDPKAKVQVRRIVDLFAGFGTFTFPLAALAPVLAVEHDTGALDALRRAAKATPGLKPIETLRRDLYDEPLSARELENIDAVIFDPPRAGAKAQAKAIAQSRVSYVVAVSCAPATLARDLKILVDGGYRIARVTPIDQFLFSHHVEVVAQLVRDS